MSVQVQLVLQQSHQNKAMDIHGIGNVMHTYSKQLQPHGQVASAQLSLHVVQRSICKDEYIQQQAMFHGH